jgi:hypothetical protein
MSKRGRLSQQLLCLAIESDTDILQFHNSVELAVFAQHWRRDVVNGNARRCFPIADAVVCMTVEDCGGPKSVDRFFKTTGTEEGIDFRIFALQRRSNWGVVQNHYSALSLQLDQGLLQANGVAD